ncbi:hypothetical protein MJ588_22075 [Klebsiella pneumoniae]|nr:hypothetical protein MJ588_22075 [Klebsiella pneumoniae]
MLRTMADDLKNQARFDDRCISYGSGRWAVSLIAGGSKDVTDRVKAGELVAVWSLSRWAVKGAVVRIWRRPVVLMRLLSLQR